MALRTFSLCVAHALVLSSLAACSAPKPEPEIASSAPQGHYAATYPQDLTSAATGFSQGQTEVRDKLREVKAYPSELKEPDWSRVRQVVEAADRDGKSYAYVERMRRVSGANDFFTTEKDEITKKVAGSAQYVAKQKGCDVDIQGAVAKSLQDSIDKQLEKELREASEAHQLIERHKGTLGKANIDKLETQADTISRASYLVHVALVEQKLRIKRMVEEAEEVRKTADRFIEAERELQADKNTTDAEKKASEERIAEMNKSKSLLDSSIQQGNDLLPKLDEQIQNIQKEYDDALAELLSVIDKRAQEQSPKP